MCRKESEAVKNRFYIQTQGVCDADIVVNSGVRFSFS